MHVVDGNGVFPQTQAGKTEEKKNEKEERKYASRPQNTERGGGGDGRGFEGRGGDVRKESVDSVDDTARFPHHHSTRARRGSFFFFSLWYFGGGFGTSGEAFGTFEEGRVGPCLVCKNTP